MSKRILTKTNSSMMVVLNRRHPVRCNKRSRKQTRNLNQTHNKSGNRNCRLNVNRSWLAAKFVRPLNIQFPR